MLTHVVLIKLKDRRPEAIAAIRAHLDTLAGNIPSLRGIEVGTDVLRSGRSFDLALIARFDDLAGLAAYQSHSVHLPVLAAIGAAAETVVAVDYEG
ncbi:MAG: Dabb family protein [Candidatus Promineofilum sp.]|nr:Dabb family protein [Promineifilum sp.]MCW5865319.1 Dabb family protein [Anaerolineae bacterium]